MKLAIFAVVAIFIIAGCTGAVETLPKQPVESIDIFVNSFNFPNQQEIKILFDFPEENVKIFQVTFGEPKDCPSGCFYSSATGMKHGAKLGWISIDNYDRIPGTDEFVFDTSPMEMYDFDSTDTILFSEEFLSKLKIENEIIYQQDFLPLLAKDPDTPKETLTIIAHGLSTWINPFLAESLLENPLVQEDQEILTIISTLPVFQGDAYKEVRETAQNLL